MIPVYIFKVVFKMVADFFDKGKKRDKMHTATSKGRYTERASTSESQFAIFIFKFR